MRESVAKFTRHYESALKYAAQQVMADTPLMTGALSVSVVVKRSIPQSWSKKKQEQDAAFAEAFRQGWEAGRQFERESRI